MYPTRLRSQPTFFETSYIWDNIQKRSEKIWFRKMKRPLLHCDIVISKSIKMVYFYFRHITDFSLFIFFYRSDIFSFFFYEKHKHECLSPLLSFSLRPNRASWIATFIACPSTPRSCIPIRRDRHKCVSHAIDTKRKNDTIDLTNYRCSILYNNLISRLIYNSIVPTLFPARPLSLRAFRFIFALCSLLFSKRVDWLMIR